MIPSEIWIWGGSSTRSHQQSTATLPWSSMQVMISGWLYYLRTGTANDLPDEVNASASREQITLGKHTPSAESDGEDATWKNRGTMLLGGGGDGDGGGKKVQ